MEEDLLYDDFNGIRITSKKFYAGKKAYALNKIRKINLQRVTPHKLIGIVLFVVGIVTILLGSLEVLPTLEGADEQWFVDLNFVSIALGVVSIVVAVIRMLLYPDEYAVEVEIKDGIKESIKSNSRKYAARLAASLKRAYYRQKSRKSGRDHALIA